MSATDSSTAFTALMVTLEASFGYFSQGERAAAMEYFENECRRRDVLWAVLFEVLTGKLVANYREGRAELIPEPATVTDADRLLWLIADRAVPDAVEGVAEDRYDLAQKHSRAQGREAPNLVDELNGLRELIDAAIRADRGDSPPIVQSLLQVTQVTARIAEVFKDGSLSLDSEEEEDVFDALYDDILNLAEIDLTDHDTPQCFYLPDLVYPSVGKRFSVIVTEVSPIVQNAK